MNIIELAREAGFHKWYTQPKEHPDHVAIVARFAALIRAEALEEAEGVCEEVYRAGRVHQAQDCVAAIRALKEKT
jgi:hypothetical protein